jgi:hypothetical protein
MVAGAAEGLGAAFCGEMARRGMNVILVDVKQHEMESLSGKIEKQYRVKTKQVLQDLSEKEAPLKCLAAMSGLDCRLLVYNAAYSRVKHFLEAAPEELDLYINVNTRTPEHLVYLFAKKLKESQETGGILLMSSLAGLWGTRLVATYSGTKAFNLLLAEALSYELKPYRISVSACCAGATATPGYLGTNPVRGIFGPSVMDPERVAAYALKKLGRKTVILPGLANRFNYFLLTRILPRSLSVGMVNKVMKHTYRNIM